VLPRSAGQALREAAKRKPLLCSDGSSMNLIARPRLEETGDSDGRKLGIAFLVLMGRPERAYSRVFIGENAHGGRGVA
jgi:hypothetical protein